MREVDILKVFGRVESATKVYQYRCLLVVSKGERRCSKVSDRLHRRQVTLISGEVTFTEVKSPVLKGTLRPPHRKLRVRHLNPLGYDETLRELESRECSWCDVGNQRYPSARNSSADL